MFYQNLFNLTLTNTPYNKNDKKEYKLKLGIFKMH